ncbi:DNA-directed DNA polymerase [Sarracenia purpurea var. burkii]
MGLLSWLASSQAAEDINSDDELACETILTPLLPAATVDKVLEKANMDFESESQRECQDILDSVEDSLKFEFPKEGTSSMDHGYLNHSLSEKTIPQVDGSVDDHNSIPNAGESSKIEIHNEIDRFPRDAVRNEISSSFTCKNKQNKPLWGSLPFSFTEMVNEDPEFYSRWCIETKEGNTTSPGVKNEVDRDVYDLKEETTLVGCSVRDLMRKKRCRQFEASETESRRVRKVSLYHKQSLSTANDSSLQANRSNTSKVQNLDTDDVTTQTSGGSTKTTNSAPTKSLKFLNSANQKFEISGGCCENDNIEESKGFYSVERVTSEVCIGKRDLYSHKQNLDTDDKQLVNEKLQPRGSTGAKCSSASPVQSEILGIADCMCRNGHEGQTFRQRVSEVSEVSSANVMGMEATTGSTVLQFENCGGVQHETPTDLAAPARWPSAAVNLGANPMEFIGMTFHKKPPMVDWVVGTLKNASLTFDIAQDISLEGISVEREHVDELLPFFEGECSKVVHARKKSSRNNESDNHQRVMGVPTHYQNDGSHLYMLTPVFSPPSADSVSRWLLHDYSGKNSNASSVPVEQSSPKGSSCSQNSSHGSLINSCKRPLSEFGSVSGMEPPILGQLNQQADGDLNSETIPFGKGATAMCQSGCNITKRKECSDGLLDISQISGPDGKSKATPLSQIGFRDPASFGEGQQLTLLSIEVQAESRGELRPDPRFDAINVIVLVFQEDNDSSLDVYVLLRSKSEYHQRNLDGLSGCKILASSEEKYLFSHFMNIICSIDPDILMGWDIQGGSVGYLAERALHLGIGLLNGISRTPTETKVAVRESGVSERGILDNVLPETLVSDSIQLEDVIIEDEWGRTHASGVHVDGRIALNIWRLMRGELKLNMYTVEAVADAVLRRKIPYIPSKILTRWFSSGPWQARYRCIEYVVNRAKLNLEIMNQLDMINRTSELARVFGIDFFSVLSRGSQYRVESMLLRLAHTQNYVAISPGKQQVATQPAMECLPLVMEPESGFCADPVVVLDFQQC